jgi:hypothetical protein
MAWSEHDLVDATVRRLVAGAELHDPEVTALMGSVAGETDGWLVGLPHRVKTVESLTRKLNDLVAQNPTRGVEAASSQVYDVLRYTVVATDDRYMEVHDQVLDGLRQRGATVVLDANRWAGPGYRGINVRLRVGDWRFEVQFHTPASYEATKATRGYYEEERLAETPEARKDELHEMTDAIFAPIPVPPGALS